ncbi:MAG TPA: glucose-6-phosphate dehydrogenase assembly protein OpcA [Solirubrobacteraceae bacterium]|jgi:glucose-6-phosphate dehydrogenase assembly protein OpcA|nr:glucose-6-phosphate dehydrogenase assembly protein OpcA [Solirubrobacteraceae bacterium]
MPAASDAVWSAQNTTPDAIEAALRELVIARHAENGGFAPARALNMIAFVDAAWSGEIANRLRGVGRYHASRLIVFSYEPARERLDARASVASEGDPRPGELSLLRETVIVEIGDRHLDDLLTIADPLVVSDLLTLLWSPHGHHELLGELLPLAQAVLLDSVDEPDPHEAISRAQALAREAYVVDLAWLRSTPWRERLATIFDPPSMRRQLHSVTKLAIRHHPESAIAAMLLVGWLASRLHWELAPLAAGDGALSGTARAHQPAPGGERIAVCLHAAPEQQVRGLAGVELHTAAGVRLRLDRGAGGLQAHRHDRDGKERSWTLLGASRGEAGVLGEGIRQALLRDPTYTPALASAAQLVP